MSGLLVAGTSAFPWLVTVLTSAHLLLAASADSPGALGVLPYFPMVVRTLAVGPGFSMLPACPSPSFRLWVYSFNWLLFSTRVPYLCDGVTPAGSRIVCPRSERRFGLSIEVRYTGQFLAGPPASVCGYLSARSSGYVARWSSLCPSPAVHLSSLQGSSRSLVRVQCCLPDPC